MDIIFLFLLNRTPGVQPGRVSSVPTPPSVGLATHPSSPCTDLESSNVTAKKKKKRDVNGQFQRPRRFCVKSVSSMRRKKGEKLQAFLLNYNRSEGEGQSVQTNALLCDLRASFPSNFAQRNIISNVFPPQSCCSLQTAVEMWQTIRKMV